jgi:hypothetical protein
MKSTAATSLTLCAVLGAGVLAAAANLRVFAGPDRAVSAGAIGTAQPSPVEVDPSPAPEAGAGEPQAFRVGPAGSLTLDATGGLHLVGIDPASGWWAAERRPGEVGTVAVDFQSPSGGRIVVTAVSGPDGIRVLAHNELATLAPTGGDDDADLDDD